MTRLALLAISKLLSACMPLASASDPTLPDTRQTQAVKARFEAIQHLSFATHVEYCGYLLRLEGGAYGFTEMVRGGHDGCTPVLPGHGAEVIASMHTHGSYHPDVPAEFPTVIDMDSDRREGVNGYIATPGGRLWFIDGQARVAVQLCGLGCLPQDPEFRAGDDGEIAQSYTRAELVRLEQQL